MNKKVETAEDYRDYIADKTLWDALKGRGKVPTVTELIRKQMDEIGRKEELARIGQEAGEAPDVGMALVGAGSTRLSL